MTDIKIRFTHQTRLSTDGNTLKDYFKGDILVVDEELARSTVLSPGMLCAEVLETKVESIEVQKTEDIETPEPTDVESQVDTDVIERKIEPPKRKGKGKQ